MKEGYSIIIALIGGFAVSVALLGMVKGLKNNEVSDSIIFRRSNSLYARLFSYLSVIVMSISTVATVYIIFSKERTDRMNFDKNEANSDKIYQLSKKLDSLTIELRKKELILDYMKDSILIKH